MLRIAIPALLALVPLLGCTPAAPTTTTPVETPPPVQETVSYLAKDNGVHGYLCHPAGPGKSPAVLLIHDNMGLTDSVKDAAFRLARHGYVALAVDLYRGQTAKSIEDAKRLQSELPKERALSDLRAAVDYLLDRADVRAEKVLRTNEQVVRQWTALGVIGMGMGGGYALEAALRDDRLRAAVLCYCPLPADAKQLKPLMASVFYLYGDKGGRVSAKAIEAFCQAMQEARKIVERIRVYIDSSYGFLDSAYWPHYGTPPAKDVEEAWELIERYLDQELS